MQAKREPDASTATGFVIESVPRPDVEFAVNPLALLRLWRVDVLGRAIIYNR